MGASIPVVNVVKKMNKITHFLIKSYTTTGENEYFFYNIKLLKNILCMYIYVCLFAILRVSV